MRVDGAMSDQGERDHNEDLRFRDVNHAYVMGLVAAAIGQSEMIGGAHYRSDKPSITFQFGARHYELILGELQ